MEDTSLTDTEYSKILREIWFGDWYYYDELYLSDNKDRISSEEMKIWDSIALKDKEYLDADKEEDLAREKARDEGVEREEQEVPDVVYTEEEQAVKRKATTYFKETYESPCSPEEQVERTRKLAPFKGMNHAEFLPIVWFKRHPWYEALMEKSQSSDRIKEGTNE
jgi:hypothetical protein